MKIKATVVFTFDSGDQTLEECRKYLEQSNGSESLEWMDADAVFTFEAAE